MDALSPQDPCQEVVCKFSSQAGKTEILLNFIGYIIDQDPGPTMVIQPNEKPMAEAFSKDRIAPMLRDTPSLREKVKTHNKKNQNTMMHKSFAGGHLTMGSAISPAGLASRPIRYLLFDEPDRYEITKEGHAIPLATKRTATFHNRKIAKVSSPTYDDVGIDAEYEACEQQFEYHLDCPDCGESQFPGLRHFAWKEKDVRNADYVCEHCGVAHPMSQESRIKSKGRWVQTKNEGDRSKGFWMNQFASPFATWGETLFEFISAKSSPEKLKVVVNTAFAETWKEGEELDQDTLFGRREDYQLPNNIAVLTAGIDVQGDRLEVEVTGWALGEESFGVEYKIIPGDPSQGEVWQELTALLRKTYTSEDGAAYGIYAACIDSGGHHTQIVYDYCSRRPIQRLYAIKGMAGEARPIANPRDTVGYPQKRKAIMIGVDAAKSLLFSYLKQIEVGPGYCHFPMSYDQEYFLQLTAEKVRTKFKNGFPKREWVKTRARNEALDCRVYSLAALKLTNPNLEIIHRAMTASPAPRQQRTRRESTWFKR